MSTAHPSTSPNAPIALIGRFAPGEEQLWLEALRRALPAERVFTIDSIANPAEVELAIVANADPAALRRLDGLIWVQSLWVGVEKLLAEPALEHLPIVRMVDTQLARTMAEAVLAWSLYLHREMPAYLAQQRQRQWRQLPYVAPAERRIGLLGLGVLGQAAATTLVDAGFTVRGWSRTPKRMEGVETCSGRDGLAAMARQTDILVCLLPLTGQTRHLVDATLLELLPPRACVINFGRGPLVHTEDLLAALDSKRLAHAVLDVFDEEPLPAESPLWDHPAITVLPHISADTDPQTASLIVARNVRHWRETGRVPQPVEKQRGY